MRGPGLIYALGALLASLVVGISLGLWVFALGGAGHTLGVPIWLLMLSALLGGLCAAAAGLAAIAFVRQRATWGGGVGREVDPGRV